VGDEFNQAMQLYARSKDWQRFGDGKDETARVHLWQVRPG